MTSLVIVESPAKAKTISRFLGNDYIVEASYGHVRDLPGKADEIPDKIKKESWARFGVNLDKDFEPVYIIPDSKKKQVQKLKQALKQSDEVLLATDEDREGESISWHLLELLKPKVPVRRIVFHEITPEAIQHAVDNPREINHELVNAQESRRILDRLYGYSLSPVLWRKVQSGLSAGRVQSVAVRLIVEREEERRAFVASEYWDLEADIATSTGGFTATLNRIDGKRLASGKDFDSSTGQLKTKTVEHLSGERATVLAQTLGEKLPWRVTKVEGKPGKENPGPPFTTSTLQQEANRKLGFGADRTMRIAQKLYEGVDLGGGERVGIITYMRTDSVTLSSRAMAQAQDQIEKLYGKNYARGPRQFRTKARNAQEAHEAIRPTDLGRRPQDIEKYLSKEELRLYDLIWKKTLASQMPPAEVLRTTLEITALDERGVENTFGASGKKITFPGFLRAYVEGSDDPGAELGDKETILPDLKEGEEIGGSGKASLSKVSPKQHVTSPPARYTEASLVKKLEEEGIGRPSTYASIISTVQNRGYVFQQKRQLVPTFTAMAVTNLMRDHFGEYVDIKFTARLENELDDIAAGQREMVDHLHEFYRGEGKNGANGTTNGNGKHTGLVKVIAREQERIEFPRVPLGTDEGTSKDVAVRVGRYGPYIVRGEGGDGNQANVPDDMAPADLSLNKAIELINRKAEGPQSLGDHPEHGLPIFVARGRYGPYVQLGEVTEENKKPKRASLPKGMNEDDATLDLAIQLLSLPRELGAHPESGDPVLANNGRFGPYVQHQKDYRSIPKDQDVYTISFDAAMELLKQPKRGRKAAAKTVLKALGKRDDGTEIQVLDGRYGPYVSDGKVNATLPNDTDPQSVTLENALELIAKKAATKGKKGAKKAVKKSAKKAAKKATKKAAKKAAKKS